MSLFGETYRQLADYESRLLIFTTLLDLKIGKCSLRLIGESDHAEIYEVLSEGPVFPGLVVKCPPFRKLDIAAGKSEDKTDAFDKGCFAILREIDALHKIGSCGFVNMAEYAKSVLDIPVLIFRKRDTDLRTLVTKDFSAGDRFVRLTLLHMVARGLVLAQERGALIHQDLKPENILIDFIADKYRSPDDFPPLAVPRINDFEWMNKILGSRLRGFRPYLPAEHYQQGNAESRVSVSYDIYSLAIIAHELLTCGYHPMPRGDGSPLHCSEYVGGYSKSYGGEEKWKKWARKPASEKILPMITDRALALTLSAALDPDFNKRPSAAVMAQAFRKAMERENVHQAHAIEVTIDFLESSGEIGSGNQCRFPEQARRVLSQFAEQSIGEFG